MNYQTLAYDLLKMGLFMKKSLTFFGILLVCLVLTSCSGFEVFPNSPPIQFDAAYLNKQIQLLSDPRFGPLKVNNFVGLLLRYNTDNEITFPNDDYNLRLFIAKDGNWLEIHEAPAIRSQDKVILSPSIPVSYAQIVSFFPQLDDTTKAYNMRVYVFGDMRTPEGIKQVAAFVDFRLRP